MNSSQSKDPQASASAKCPPIILDAGALNQVAGGSVVINDPGWLVAPSAQPHGVVKVPDPGW